MTHEAFLHDDSCQTCLSHRWAIDEVRREMLEQLREALDRAGVARPWSPQEEWDRCLRLIGAGQALADIPGEVVPKS